MVLKYLLNQCGQNCFGHISLEIKLKSRIFPATRCNVTIAILSRLLFQIMTLSVPPLPNTDCSLPSIFYPHDDTTSLYWVMKLSSVPHRPPSESEHRNITGSKRNAFQTHTTACIHHPAFSSLLLD